MQRDEAIRHLVGLEVLNMSSEDAGNEALDLWGVEPDDAAWSRLSVATRTLISHQEEPKQGDDISELVALSVSLRLETYSNLWLGRRMSERLGRVVHVVGRGPVLMACACCGFESLPSRGEYDVCPVCMWEDDGTDLSTVFSAPNRASMKDYRTTASFLDAMQREERDPRYRLAEQAEPGDQRCEATSDGGR